MSLEDLFDTVNLEGMDHHAHKSLCARWIGMRMAYALSGLFAILMLKFRRKIAE